MILLSLDKSSHEPLYLQVAGKLKSMISSGTLKKGDRLPPGRVLASQLKVHRTTVSNAYEKLEEEGILYSHVGRGTFVLETHPVVNERKETESISPIIWETLFASESSEDRLHALLDLRGSSKATSFVYALPSPDLFPVSEFQRCVNSALRKEGGALLQAGDSAGYAPLRDYLARIYASNRNEQVLITNGCQQSISLVRKVLVAAGDTVLVENPTYPGALTVFNEKDIRCIGVSMTPNGPDLEMLENILSAQPVKLFYTIPNFHNPTGSTMDLATRHRLLQLSTKYRMPIVEDDIYGELHFESNRLPTLKELDESGNVILINSFSKTGFPGARVGWVVGPQPLIERLRDARQSHDLHTNLLAQAAFFEMLQSGIFARHVKKVRRIYRARRDQMLMALKKYLPATVTWSRPEGGMSIWVTLPEGVDTAHLLSLSSENGIFFSPGQLFFLNAVSSSSLRLAFSMTDVSRLEGGVKSLGRIIRKQLAQAVSPVRAASTVLV